MNFSTKSKKLLFNYWQPLQETDRFFLYNYSKDNNPEKLLTYTAKSLDRESKSLSQKLDQVAKENSKFFWIAPFHENIFYSLNSRQKCNLFWICCANFSTKKFSELIKLQAENNCLIFDFRALQFALQEIQKDNSIKIEFHPSLRNSSIFQELKGSIQDMIQEVALRLKTIQHFENIWCYNFKANFEKWKRCHPASEFEPQKPDYFILGGPSVTEFLKRFDDKKKTIWSADTSWMPLVHRGILPDLVFSIDAGYGSFEHFIYHATRIEKEKVRILLDPLSFPKFYNAGIKAYSYISSNPLIQQAVQEDNQELEAKFPFLSNETGDVYGIMQSFYFYLFPETDLPQVIGHDKGPRKFETHLRGSGYHEREYTRSNRLETTENHFFKRSLSFF